MAKSRKMFVKKVANSALYEKLTGPANIGEAWSLSNQYFQTTHYPKPSNSSKVKSSTSPLFLPAVRKLFYLYAFGVLTVCLPHRGLRLQPLKKTHHPKSPIVNRVASPYSPTSLPYLCLTIVKYAFFRLNFALLHTLINSSTPPPALPLRCSLLPYLTVPSLLPRIFFYPQYLL